MAIVRMDNVLLVVDDLEAATSFFIELGMEVEGRMPIEGEWSDRVIGLEDARSEIVMLRPPDGHGGIELSKFDRPSAIASEPRNAPVNTLGFRRVMFTVDDLDDTIARLQTLGAELVGDVAQYEDVYRLCFIRGPEGIILGLAQELSWHSGMPSELRGVCIACHLTNGDAPLPGGVIYQTDHWRVEHCIGPLGVGTLIVKPLRHVTHLADLTDAETAEMGPMLRAAARACTDLTDAEQVYACLWSHTDRKPGHIHFVIQPVSAETMRRFDAHGPALQVAMFGAGELPDPEAVAAFSELARRRFADHWGAP